MMHHVREFGLILALALSNLSCVAQSSPGQNDYDKHLRELQKDLVTWKSVIESLKVEEFTIGYQHGKLLADSQHNALKRLSLISTLTSRILVSHRLSNQISLVVNVDGLENDLFGLAHSLLEYSSDQDEKYSVEIAQKLGDIAGAVDKESNYQTSTVERLADLVQDKCRGKS